MKMNPKVCLVGFFKQALLVLLSSEKPGKHCPGAWPNQKNHLPGALFKHMLFRDLTPKYTETESPRDLEFGSSSSKLIISSWDLFKNNPPQFCF